MKTLCVRILLVTATMCMVGCTSVWMYDSQVHEDRIDDQQRRLNEATAEADRLRDEAGSLSQDNFHQQGINRGIRDQATDQVRGINNSDRQISTERRANNELSKDYDRISDSLTGF